MKTGTAFIAGVIGGAVMSALMWMARTFMEIPASLGMMLGTMIGLEPGTSGTWIVGFAMHLVISGLIALIYAWGFERVIHRAGWFIGALFGVLHAIIGGLFMGILPSIHPQMPLEVFPPGAFMSNLGVLGVMAFFVLHIVYGAIVGAIYSPVLHPAVRADSRGTYAP